MSFLKNLLRYERICIQCHNDPDADCLASAFGVYSYLVSGGKQAFIVYGGSNIIRRNALLMMLRECSIPVEHTHAPSDFDLLLTVDCQYGGGNTELFPAENVAVIDHHPLFTQPEGDYLVDSTYQSCSTIVWELLKAENFALDDKLSSALLFGLYTDTALFSDLFSRKDTEMKMALYSQQPLFERLAKSNMTLAELMIASEAIHNHILNIENRFAIVEAMSCEQSLLGTIGDFIIQADLVSLCFTYTLSNNGYRLSIRSCDDRLPANEVAKFLCLDVGTGGGHRNKAGGYIDKKRFLAKHNGTEPSEIIERLITEYIASTESTP